MIFVSGSSHFLRFQAFSGFLAACLAVNCVVYFCCYNCFRSWFWWRVLRPAKEDATEANRDLFVKWCMRSVFDYAFSCVICVFFCCSPNFASVAPTPRLDYMYPKLIRNAEVGCHNQAVRKSTHSWLFCPVSYYIECVSGESCDKGWTVF